MLPESRLKMLVPRLPSPGVAGVLLYVFCLALPLNPKLALLPLGLGGVYLLIRSDGRITEPFLKVSGALAVFVAGSILSLLASDHLQQGYTASLSFAPALFLFFLVGTRFRMEDVTRLCQTIVFTCAILSASMLLTALANPGLTTTEWIRLAGFSQYGVPNDLMVLSLFAPIVLVPLFTQTHAVLRAVSGITFAIMLATLIVFQSRGGFLVLVLASLTLTLLMAPKKLVPAAFVLLGLGLAIDASTGFALTQRFLDAFSSRVPLWLAAWRMFETAPVLGHGPASFSVLGPDYLASIALPDWVHRDPRQAPWPHNLFLELMAERGLVGLISFVLLLFLGLRYATRAYNRNSQGIFGGIAAALIAGIAAIGIAGLFELSLTRHWFVHLVLIFIPMTCVLASDAENN